MQDIYAGYYKWNRILMTITGIWPDSSRTSRLVAQSFLILSTLTLLLPQYASMLKMCGTLDDIIYGIIIQMIMALGVVKFYYVATRIDLMGTVMKRMYEDHWVLSSSSAAKTISTYAERGLLGTKIYTVVMLCACSFFLLNPLATIILDAVSPLNETRPKISVMPSDYTIYGFDGNEHYYVTIIHGYISGILVMTTIIAVDTFILIIVEHCCGLFESVGTVLQQTYQNVATQSSDQFIRHAKDVHQRAITMGQLIESSFTNMYALIVFLNTALISVTGLETILMMNKPSEMTRFFICAVGLIAHLLFLSLPGQEILDHSNRLSETIYDCNWYEMSIENRQLICIMLMRSLKPFSLTAGGFYQISMENFSQVLRTSFSYFTVLLSSQ